MPGFFASNKRIDIALRNHFPERCFEDEIISSKFTVKRNTLNKFVRDKTLVETDNFVFALEGVLLNKVELFSKYSVDSIEELLHRMYCNKGDEFFREFRGGFSGLLYDKNCDKWIVFTNHSGDNPVFYAIVEDMLLVGSQVNYIIDACRAVDVPLSFNETAAYQMLTYGFMVDSSTYAKEIKRLRGGTYLLHQNGHCEVNVYHTYTKNAEYFEKATEEELIEKIDHAFKNAIRLEYSKDLEYGYEHLADLSGGLDSRMVMWVPSTMGYEPIQLLTYCKANYDDEIIAKEIASYWKHPLLIRPTDDVRFLYDIDEIVFLNAGLSLYSGISGGNRMLRTLDMNRYGLEHTGMIGDVVIGSWWANEKEARSSKVSGKYSNKLSHRLPKEINDYIHSFEDYELFLDYSRGFQGAANTYLIRKNYTEVTSPFMDVDLMQLCLDIPQKYRYGHHIYKKWIMTKYPEAAKFKWEKTGGKIDEPEVRRKLRRLIIRGPRKLLRMIGLSSKITSGMMPMDYWISRNSILKQYMDAYYNEAYSRLQIDISQQLKDDMAYLYSKGNADEKTMVLTVMSAIKLYFGEYH